MDEGTDASDVLLGKIYPLRLGSTIRDSLQKEEEFFQKTAAYRSMAARCG